MGASAWEYVVPHQPDLSAALEALRQQVFAAGEYVKPSGSGWDLPEPASVEDLFAEQQYWEFMGSCGTHTVIDIFNGVIAADDFGVEEFGTVRSLSADDCVELFGVAQPSRADYQPLAGSARLYDYVTGGRWTGRAAVLWASGAPAEILFWGFSGD
ncbi:MAG: hypothetical protein J2P29_05275 [Actinobacteria bacterium]|nr:hypothetical protein [Actinomycetota bacterium]